MELHEAYSRWRREDAERSLQERMITNEAWEGCGAILRTGDTDTYFAPGGKITGRHKVHDYEDSLEQEDSPPEQDYSVRKKTVRKKSSAIKKDSE